MYSNVCVCFFFFGKNLWHFRGKITTKSSVPSIQTTASYAILQCVGNLYTSRSEEKREKIWKAAIPHCIQFTCFESYSNIKSIRNICYCYCCFRCRLCVCVYLDICMVCFGDFMIMYRNVNRRKSGRIKNRISSWFRLFVLSVNVVFMFRKMETLKIPKFTVSHLCLSTEKC